VARHVPGVAHLLGYCHNCDAPVAPSDHGCHACGVPFGAYLDRDNLGLPELRPLPWEPGLDEQATRGVDGGAAAVAAPGAGGRISWFASDEELRGRHRAEAPPAAGFPGTSIEGTVTGADQAASEILARALRRRVAAQRRTIHTLAALLVVVAGVSIVLTLGRSGTSAPRAAPAPQAGPAPLETARQPVAAEPAPAETTEPPPQQQEQPAEAAAGLGQALDRARVAVLELVAAASRDERPIEQRIAEYEQALDSLGKLEAAGPIPGAGAQQDLAETIARVQRELERLRLKRDFFGS
jgi:hypothetical protein